MEVKHCPNCDFTALSFSEECPKCKADLKDIDPIVIEPLKTTYKLNI